MIRLAFASLLMLVPLDAANAGDAEIKSAQGTIDAQLKAFSRGDNAAAYGYAAPTIQKIFPTVDSFMSMVTGAYKPVYKPQSYDFGTAQELGSTQVVQQLLIVGPAGKTTRRNTRWNANRTAATRSRALASKRRTR